MTIQPAISSVARDAATPKLHRSVVCATIQHTLGFRNAARDGPLG